MEHSKISRLLLVLCLALFFLMLSCKKENNTPAAQEDNNSTTYSEHLGDEIPAGELAKEKAGEDLPLNDFSYTWTDSKELPDVVIVVDDFGNSGALIEDYAQLPPEVVFAILPDLSFTKKTGELASQNGHEVIIHMPMQAVSASANPGEKYLKANSSADEITSLMDSFYSQLPMAIGANNHMGSAVTANRAAMTTVLNKLNSQGLFFLDSATTAESVAPSLARSLGFPSLKRDIFLDVPDNTDNTLASKISSLGKYKGRTEPIIIITHCHNKEKLRALQKFITQIQGMGLRLTTLRSAKQISA